VRAGEPLLTLHADDPARFPAARAALADAVQVAPDARLPEGGVVLGRVEAP